MCGGGGGGAPQENPAATPTVDGSASGQGLGSLLAGGGGNVQQQQQSSLAEQMSAEAQLADLQQQLNNPDNFIPGFTAQQQGLESALQTKTDQLINNLGGREALSSPAVQQQVRDFQESQPEYTQLQELGATLQQNPSYSATLASAQEIDDGFNLRGDTRFPSERIDDPVTLPPDAGFSDTGIIGGQEINTPGEGDEVTGIFDLARGLITQPTGVPDQRLAGFTPTQLQAFQQAQEGIGSYQPYLDQATEATSQGIFGTGLAREATLDLAGQIPGQVEAGQAALSQAAQELQSFAARGAASAEEAAANILAAAQSSDPATKLAAEELMASSTRIGELAARTEKRLMEAGVKAEDVASTAAQNARSLQAPLADQMAQTTAGARGLASIGQAGADVAADRARLSTAEAQSALQAASRFGQTAAEQGIAGLAGTSAMYDPSLSRGFMSQYEDAAVQQALSDIARQGELQERQLESEAVQAGAFGGSRQAVAEAELQRNILEQQGRTAAQMRAAGFESAAERSQSAFEQALGRQQQASQLTGQLGQMGAGSAASAAQAAGQLGLSAEELAQSSALQGAQLGMSAEQMAAANAQAVAQTGLNIEQLAAQTGLNAQEIAGNFAAQAGQIGLSAEQQRQAAASRQAELAQAQAQIGMQGAESAGNMQMAGAQMQMQGAQAAGDLGLQSANLGLAGIQAGLGAQQQAAGLSSNIATMGQQFLGQGQAGQQMGLQDINTLLGIGGQQQGQIQAGYDTAYQNQYRQAMEPYQQLAYYSDIVTGAPSGQASTMSQPGPSIGSQLMGAGLGIYGLSQSGMFGNQ
mgnify:CR=1 FL=1